MKNIFSITEQLSIFRIFKIKLVKIYKCNNKIYTFDEIMYNFAFVLSLTLNKLKVKIAIYLSLIH